MKFIIPLNSLRRILNIMSSMFCSKSKKRFTYSVASSSVWSSESSLDLLLGGVSSSSRTGAGDVTGEGPSSGVGLSSAITEISWHTCCIFDGQSHVYKKMISDSVLTCFLFYKVQYIHTYKIYKQYHIIMCSGCQKKNTGKWHSAF